MNKNLLSIMAQTITPYQWAKNVGQEVLRFDTNTLPSPPPCVNKFLKDLIAQLTNTEIPHM